MKVVDMETNSGKLYNGEIQIGYEGKYVKHGKGAELNPQNGQLYEGYWHNNNKHCHGRIIYADGSLYIGEFNDGVRQGHGTWKSLNESYEGDWLHDCYWGYGEKHYFNGAVYSGLW